MQFQTVELQQRAEKSVCWNTKFLLIEHRTCHDISPRQKGGCGILGHTASCKLHCHHIPLTHEVLQVLFHDLRRGPTKLRHGSEGKERQHHVSSITSPYF
jgi:hypothetical protein